jgi:hypothetical protein
MSDGYTVHYIDRQTGDRVAEHFDFPWKDHSEFWHTAGNFGCDCNRGTAFVGAGLLPPLEEEETRCSYPGYEMGNRFLIERVQWDNGIWLFEMVEEVAEDGSTRLKPVHPLTVFKRYADAYWNGGIGEYEYLEARAECERELEAMR